MLSFFYGKPNFPLIPKVGHSSSTKKYLACNDELLSKPKTVNFLAVSFLKLAI